ncbi:predicted protein [Naegleria gruberi]|uniref:Predicted protein n=1 Tax=Naegleria gruberi TaxID=5762 RepID=D2UXF3_NAEGR|nr:uncharacterized protein NAEGRDRAFT_61103 [Naegleria gruberi]EFC50622.1 predicted protein [Naegleria gruberi]|eukprot:XP_002683366.1 predicted protein [Naegleria gruberi strain NEG-M]
MTSEERPSVQSHDVNNTQLVKTTSHTNHPSEWCCMGPHHLLFGDTRANNKYASYFAWMTSVLSCCILFPPLATYFLLYQHPREKVRYGLSEAMTGSTGVMDFSTRNNESETGAHRNRVQTETEELDTNRLMWVLLSFMLTVLCWVPAIVFNLVLYFCCISPLQQEKEEIV